MLTLFSLFLFFFFCHLCYYYFTFQIEHLGQFLEKVVPASSDE